MKSDSKELSKLYEYIKKTYYKNGGIEEFFLKRAKSDSIKETQLLLTKDKELKKLAYKLFSSTAFSTSDGCILTDGFFCTCYRIFNVKVPESEFPCSGCDKERRAMLSREIERRMAPEQLEFVF